MAAAELPLILLDRDGVINRDSADYIKAADEWEALPGSLEAIAALTAAGFSVAVITNQSGIGRGLFTETALAQIHARMLTEVEALGGKLEGIYYCPHTPDDGCGCRKPQPGLLLQAIADLGQGSKANPAAVFAGDKRSDVAAAIAAGVEPLFIGGDDDPELPSGVNRCADLATAAAALIDRFGKRN